ncbi:MAG: hypothetical protein ACJAV1_003493 [Paraglaciecola sp.]|jgi:hypothetical protein
MMHSYCWAQLMLMTGLLVPGQSDNDKNNNKIGAYYYFYTMMLFA